MKSTRGQRETILVVNEDPAVVVLIQSILMATGYRVIPVTEPADAARVARQKHLHVDLLLMDPQLAGTSGTALGDEILAMRPDIRMLGIWGMADEAFIRIKVLDECHDLLPAVRKALQAKPGRSQPKKYPAEKVLTAGGRNPLF